jgi:hypothetical protein
MNIILIIIAIEFGIRLLPLLDSLAELANHFIAIGVQKCDSKIRRIAYEDEKEEQSFSSKSLSRIGFTISDAPAPEEDDIYED